MLCNLTAKRQPYKYAVVVLLFNVACVQTFSFAVSTDSWRVNAEAVKSPVLGSLSHKNPPPSNTSITFITHQQFGEGYLFCKIEGACRLGDGTVLLPSWMASHSKRIQHCGFQSHRYDIDTSHGVPLVKGTDGVTAKHHFRDIDVVGNEPPPGERPLLAQHLTPTLIIIDLLKRPSAYRNITTRTCITETGTLCSHEVTNNSVPSINPMIFIDSRVSHTKDFMWPKSLLRLIRNSMEGQLQLADLKDIYGWKITSQALCFRSISSTNVRTMDIPEKAFAPDHLFFSMNGLTRKPAEYSSPSTSTCNVKVLILNRYGKRFMEGSDLLLSVISSFGRELSKLGHSINVVPEEVFFEHSSFHEQVSIMQESDVVVATHGEANSNFMFLRPNTKVFEILPFGLSATVYQNLSRAYDVRYETVRSQPDTEVFSACVEHFNADNTQARKIFIDQWEKVAKEFTQETIRSEENVQSNFSVAADDQPDLKMLKECTLYQRTSVDIRDLARRVLKAATTRCHLSLNLTSLGN